MDIYVNDFYACKYANALCCQKYKIKRLRPRLSYHRYWKDQNYLSNIVT